MMMRNILFSTLLVASYLTLAQPAHAIGYNYDYINNVYYRIKQKKNRQQSAIYKIDFAKKSYSKILSFSSPSGWLNLSPNKKLISYYTDKKQYIYDLKKRRVIFSLNIQNQRPVVWSDDSKRISFHDRIAKKIIEIDLNKIKAVKVNCDCDVWKTKWDRDKKIFYYQLSIPEGGAYGDSKKSSVYRIDNGKLIKVKHIASFSISPDGKYHYRLTYGEDDSYFYLYRSNGDKIGQYASPGYTLTDNESKTIWRNGRLRIVGLKATFNLSTGTVYNSSSYWQEGNEPKKIYSKYDRAMDRSDRYILMWNSDKKQFEVEDINTEKIVKTYKKFW